jgi:hypothetical protein
MVEEALAVVERAAVVVVTVVCVARWLPWEHASGRRAMGRRGSKRRAIMCRTDCPVGGGYGERRTADLRSLSLGRRVPQDHANGVSVRK